MAKIAVAPLVGAWIEIPNAFELNTDNMVAPLVGAWIEISKAGIGQALDYGRSPRGSVD